MHRVRGLGRLQGGLGGGWAKEGIPSQDRGRGMRSLGEGLRREMDWGGAVEFREEGSQEESSNVWSRIALY